MQGEPDIPSIARMYDWWLGGKDSFEADREAAAGIERALPAARVIAVRNRQFVARAVTWLAERGTARYLDLGSGIPAATLAATGGELVRTVPVHEAARAVQPAARVVYVDCDQVAVTHASVLAAGPGICAVRGDVTDPGRVLADPAVREVTGPGGPCGVILGMVLHLMPADAARAVVAAFAAAVPPGSHVVISVVRFGDRAVSGAVRDVVWRTGHELHDHPEADVRSFFAGLDLVPPGIVPARSWRAQWRESRGPDGPAYVLAGVGQVRG